VAASASQVRSALNKLAEDGVARLAAALPLLSGSPETIRGDLLDLAPSVIFTYTDGSSALAADWYDDLREESAPPRLYLAEPVVADRSEKVHRMVAWAAEPLFGAEPDMDQVALRLLPDVQKEIARPFRDTITLNTKRDPASVGWRRIASGQGCKWCRALSDKGAIFKESTARFAAHSNCHCSAAPVFDGEDGPEASAMQYVASQRKRTPAERKALRDFLNAHYPDAHG
jgi:hypothetical protein